MVRSSSEGQIIGRGYSVRHPSLLAELLRLEVTQVNRLAVRLVVELDGMGVAVLVGSISVGNNVNPNGAFVVLVLGD